MVSPEAGAVPEATVRVRSSYRTKQSAKSRASDSVSFRCSSPKHREKNTALTQFPSRVSSSAWLLIFATVLSSIPRQVCIMRT